jgi:acyl dehydratase
MGADSPPSAPSAPVALAAGDTMPVATVGPITRTDIVRYAGAGGDFNPIHHDEPFARDLGLPSVFSMGMLQGGALAQRVGRWVGPENVVSMSMRFTGQVWPGDALTLEGRVTGVDDDAEATGAAGADGATATIEAAATRDGGEVVVRLKARVRVAGRRKGT